MLHKTAVLQNCGGDGFSAISKLHAWMSNIKKTDLEEMTSDKESLEAYCQKRYEQKKTNLDENWESQLLEMTKTTRGSQPTSFGMNKLYSFSRIQWKTEKEKHQIGAENQQESSQLTQDL